MEIIEEEIAYKANDPLDVQLYRIQHMAPHFHENSMEFIYCIKGTVDFYAGFQQGTLTAGQIFSIDCRDIHTLHSDFDNIVMTVHLNLKGLDKDFEFLRYVYFACESQHCYPYQAESMKWLQHTFLSLALARGIDSGASASGEFIDPAAEIDYRLTANKIISIMLRYFNYYTYLNFDGYINPPLYDRFHRILIYCHKNFREKISVSQLAAEEHISRNYVSQFLRKTNFNSFNLMIKFIRCYEAENLLLTTQMSVADISFACGFSDPKYFYSAFKIHWGCTPAEHRRKYKKLSDLGTDFAPLSDSEKIHVLKNCIVRQIIKESLLDDTAADSSL